MSGFDADWLALREAADERSRADLPLGRIRARRQRGSLRVLDLGSGTGANLRFLAPRIGGAQSWLLVDQDRRLLAATHSRMKAWARRCGYGLTLKGDAVGIRGPGLRCSYRLQAMDMARQPNRLPVSEQDLVTASALLDLVSEPWIEGLVRSCRAARVGVLFALSYDGRVQLRPSLGDDRLFLDAVNGHQRQDKGFGPALGPAASATTREILTREGYRVRQGSSDWRIEPGEVELQRRLLSGWADAAAQMVPGLQDRLQAWHRAREELLACGGSRLAVGHQDLIASWEAGDAAPGVTGSV